MFRYLDTTYNVDYQELFPYVERNVVEEKEKDVTDAYRKCHSQFTDVDDYRRHGRNTWHNETGLYANSDMKKDVFKKTDTIAPRN